MSYIFFSKKVCSGYCILKKKEYLCFVNVTEKKLFEIYVSYFYFIDRKRL